MKKLIVLVVSIVMGLSTMACGDASATESNKAALSYWKISGSGFHDGKTLDHEVRATLQQAMAANGFSSRTHSLVKYEAKATWSADNKFVTICTTSEDLQQFGKSESLLPGGCVSVSSSETGIQDAIGIALLPKAAEKMALMLKNQIDGKAMPPAETSPPISPTNETVASPPTAPKAAANANTKK